MDAEEAFGTDDRDRTVRSAYDAGQGLFDLVIECKGVQEPRELVRERGRLVVAGFRQDGPRRVGMQLWNWRGIDVVNAHERESSVYLRGMREGAEAVARWLPDPEPLYIHTYPLSLLDEAFRATAERPDGFVKAIVSME